MTPPVRGPSLAAMVTALAEVTAAQHEEHLTWNQIAQRYAYPTGRQAKKDIHALRGHVTRQLRLARNRNG